MIIDYFDTSAILANGKLLNKESYVSHFVVSELEEIKYMCKVENIKFLIHLCIL